MWASRRPCVMTATDVTRLAVSRNGATSPAMSRISSVRGKMGSALEWTDCDERASTSRHRKPRRAHSFARKRPTGPAPTIKTSVSTASGLGRGDFRRHRPRPLLAPSGKTGGPAPGATARADDEQVVRILEDVAPGRLVGRDDLAGKAARPLVVGDPATRVLHEELLDVALGPAALAEDLAVLAGEDEQGLVEAAHVGDAAARQRVGEAEQERLGRGGELVVDLIETVRRVHRHRALIMAEAALDMKRLPGMLVLVFREAEGVLSGIAEGGPVEQAGPCGHHVHHHQPHGPADRGVRARALPEGVVAGVDAER